MTNQKKHTNATMGVLPLGEYTLRSDSSVIMEGYAMRIEDDKRVAVEIAKQVEEANKALSAKQRAVIEASLQDGRMLTKEMQLATEGKELLFTDILFECFKKSLLLDDDFVAVQESALRTIVADFVKTKGGYGLLESAITKADSVLLEDMKILCEKTARVSAARRVRDAAERQEEINKIDFNMDEDEKEAFEYGKDNLNIDKVASYIKEKVFTVIKDEKARQSKEEALQRDLNEEAEGDTAVKESVIFGANQHVVNEATLFTALTENSYKGALEATKKPGVGFQVRNFGRIWSNILKNATKTGNFKAIRPNLLKMVNTCKTVDEINYLAKDARKISSLEKLKTNRPDIAKEIDEHIAWVKGEYTRAINVKRTALRGTAPSSKEKVAESLIIAEYEAMMEAAGAIASSAIQEDEDNDNISDFEVNTDEDDIQEDEFRQTNAKDEIDGHGSVQSDIDMDLILAESIVKYTMLEMFNTIKLEAYTPTSVRKLAQDLTK